MKPNKIPTSLPGQLLICTAISLICHSVYAAESPFADRPLSLIDEFSTKPEYNVGKPSVMLLIDDSYSMNAVVGDTKNVKVCENGYTYFLDKRGIFDDAAIRTHPRLFFEELSPFTLKNEGCREIIEETLDSNGRSVLQPKIKRGPIARLHQFDARNPRYLGKKLSAYYDGRNLLRFPGLTEDNLYNNGVTFSTFISSRNESALKAYTWFKSNIQTRSEVTRSSLEKVLNKYGDKLDWNMMSLWGSENWDKEQCAIEPKNPAEYEYGGSNQILNKLSTLFGDSYYKRPNFYSLIERFVTDSRFYFSAETIFYAKKNFYKDAAVLLLIQKTMV